MKKRICLRTSGYWVGSILLLLFSFTSFSQKNSADTTISGLVKAEDGRPLRGVTIQVAGTQVFSTSDSAGRFSVNVTNPTGKTLLFSMIGYGRLQAGLSGGSALNITLKQQDQSLDDVVVIGYGSQRRRDLTGAVGTVNMKDLQRAPVKSFDDALAGRVAGVQVTSADGQPGSTPNIVIRGGNSVTQDNSPLYVIDGFPIDNPNTNALNPADIESIEILKDASATAIYGARGANGVVIISTRRGKEGKTAISYDAYYGIQNSISKVKTMDAYEFVRLQLELFPADAPGMYTGGIGKTLEDYRDMESINWQSQLIRKDVPMQNHSLSFSGGNKDTKFSLSGSYINQEGTIINSGYKRAQGRFTLDHSVNSKFKIGLTTNYSNIQAYGTQVSGGQASELALLYWTWAYRPINASGDLDSLLNALEDGDVVSSTDTRFNPIKEAQNAYRNRVTNTLSVNGFGEYRFSPRLRLKISAGMYSNVLRYEAFDNSQTRSANPRGPSGQNGMNGSVVYTERSSYVNENTLTYNKTYRGGHNLTAVAGATIQGGQSKRYGGGAILVPNESLGINGLDEGQPYSITASSSKNTLASFLGRVNYNYKSRYLLTTSFRADGSSRFSEGNKWGYFPSAAIAWRFSNEPFFKKMGGNIFSDGKLRLSYGATGNNRVSDFAYLSTITLPVQYSYAPGGVVEKGSIPSALGNSKLKWETTYELDLGFDLSLFDQRISLTADVYRKRTKDLLLKANLPLSSGFSSAFKNIGQVENKGLEISISTENISTAHFSWKSSFNIAFNRTKLLSLNEDQTELLTNLVWENTSGYGNIPAYIAQTGQPVALFYGLVWEGNYQYSDFDEPSPGTYVLKPEVPDNGNVRSNIRPGDIKYKDLDGDNQITSADRTIIGNPNPRFIGGFINNFTYKGFDCSIFLQFVQGNDIQNASRIYFEGGAGTTKVGFNQFASYADRWTPENQNNIYFRANGQGPKAYSTRTIEDGSFLRLKTVSLGYNLPVKLMAKAKIQNLRIYASAQNLVTWSGYKGSDPEVSTYDSPLTPGFDFSAYPRARTITLGLNLSL